MLEPKPQPVPTVHKRKPGMFLTNVLKLVTGASFAQAITVLLAPILARLYTPEHFGTAALFVSTLGIVGSIACLRYELAIMLPEKDQEAVNLLALSGIIAIIISCLTAVLVIVWRVPFSLWLRNPDLASYLWMLPLAVLATGFTMALTYWHTRAKQFGRVSISRVIRSGTVSVAQLVFPLVALASAGGLIGGYTLGPISSVCALGVRTSKQDRDLAAHHIRLRAMITALKRYYKFPLFSNWAGLLNVASWQLPSLLLSRFFSPTVVGYYAFGSRLIRLPLNLLGTAIADAFFQRASEAHKTETEFLLVVESMFRGLTAVGLCPILLLSVIGRDLFVVVFGPQWAEAGVYTQILSPWVFSVFISSPFGRLFNIFERQEGSLIVNVALFATRLGALCLGGMLGNARAALWLLAGTGILVYGGQTLYVLQSSGVQVRHTLGILLRYLGLSLPSLALTLSAKFVFADSSIGVLVASLVSLLVYLVILLRFDTDLVRLLFRAMPLFGKSE